MLTPASGTVTFGEQFSITITVTSESSTVDPVTGETTTTSTPSNEVPTVTASFSDPGVTITTEPGSVTISGKYTTIIPISWTYLDHNMQPVTVPTAPATGIYEKITKVDSPPALTATCTYTISGESFVHTVTLGSYATSLSKITVTFHVYVPPFVFDFNSENCEFGVYGEFNNWSEKTQMKKLNIVRKFKEGLILSNTFELELPTIS